MPRKRFDGNPHHCGGCGKTHLDFYADGRCKVCQKAKNKVSNARYNSKRDKEKRREQYQETRAQWVGSKFRVESNIRGRIDGDLVLAFNGTVTDFELAETRKKLMKELNGNTGFAMWTIDHYVPVGVLQRDSSGKFWTGRHVAENMVLTTIDANRAKAGRKAEAQYLCEPFAMERDPKQFNEASIHKFTQMEGIIRSRVSYDIAGGDVKDRYVKPNPDDWELLTAADFVFPEFAEQYEKLSDEAKEYYCKQRWLAECVRIEEEAAAVKEEKRIVKKVAAVDRLEGYRRIFEMVCSYTDSDDVRKFCTRTDWVEDLGRLLNKDVPYTLPSYKTLIGEPSWKDYLDAKSKLGRYAELIQLGVPIVWDEWSWRIESQELSVEKCWLKPFCWEEFEAHAAHTFAEYLANGRVFPEESSFKRWTPEPKKFRSEADQLAFAEIRKREAEQAEADYLAILSGEQLPMKEPRDEQAEEEITQKCVDCGAVCKADKRRCKWCNGELMPVVLPSSAYRWDGGEGVPVVKYNPEPPAFDPPKTKAEKKRLSKLMRKYVWSVGAMIGMK